MNEDISSQTFDVVASKLQDELIDVISNDNQVNDYELIVYKYVFISELNIPVVEDLGIEIVEDAFVMYLIPDDLKFGVLAKLNDVFDKFELVFMPNSYGVIKLKFLLSDYIV